MTATAGTRMMAAPGSETSWVGRVYRPARSRCASRRAAISVPHRSSGSAQAVLPYRRGPQIVPAIPAATMITVASSGNSLRTGHGARPPAGPPEVPLPLSIADHVSHDRGDVQQAGHGVAPRAMIRGMTSPGDGRIIEANGISLYVEEHGDGDPVLMLHGWPDSARLWRHQVPVLAASGYRVITPDLRGFGRSEHPAEVRSYGLRNVVGDVRALLDQLGVETAHVVGADWGSAVAWLTAILHPDRVRTLTVMGGPHPSSPPTLRQYEMAW